MTKALFEIKYSRMNQVKFVEDSLKADDATSSFLKAVLPQILLDPFLNTFSHLWKREWALYSNYNFEIFLIFSRKLFGKSCGNSYTKFIIIKIRSRVTCGKSNLFIILLPRLYVLKYSIFSCHNTHLFMTFK